AGRRRRGELPFIEDRREGADELDVAGTDARIEALLGLREIEIDATANMRAGERQFIAFELQSSVRKRNSDPAIERHAGDAGALSERGGRHDRSEILDADAYNARQLRRAAGWRRETPAQLGARAGTVHRRQSLEAIAGRADGRKCKACRHGNAASGRCTPA